MRQFAVLALVVLLLVAGCVNPSESEAARKAAEEAQRKADKELVCSKALLLIDDVTLQQGARARAIVRNAGAVNLTLSSATIYSTAGTFHAADGLMKLHPGSGVSVTFNITGLPSCGTFVRLEINETECGRGAIFDRPPRCRSL